MKYLILLSVALLMSCGIKDGPSILGDDYGSISRNLAKIDVTADIPADLGTVSLGSGANIVLTLTSRGPSAARLGNFDNASLNLGPGFYVNGGTCVSQQTLNVGESCTVIVRFSPATEDQVSSTVRFVYSDGHRDISSEFTVKGKGRLLIFTSGQNASVVVGQPNFTSDTAATTQTGLNYPWGNPSVHDGRLYICDYYSSRVTGYNAVPTTNGAPADFVVGQTNFTNRTYSASSTTMSYPWTTSIGEGTLAVADTGNNRVLLYDGVPSTMGPAAVRVLGQANFTGNNSACTDSTLNGPSGVSLANGKLIVADYTNHRVLIWNSIPSTDGAAADVVLGQPNMTTCTQNTGGVSASSMRNPGDVWTDGTRLIVADSANNRILIWNSFPTASHQPADVVLGQDDFSNVSANKGAGVSASGVDGGGSRWSNVTSNGTQIFFSDYNNHRILIWNSWPTANGVPAQVVLGRRFSHKTVGLVS